MTGSVWSRRRVHVLALLLVSAVLRLQGLDWDEGQHLHPDERFLTMVATDTRAPRSVGEYFDTARSPMNPANAGHRFFVYGTFPLFLVKGVASGAGLGEYGHLHLVGRALAALFDVGTVVLTWRLGVLLAGPAAGLVAGMLMAFSVASIQQSHFFTVDSFATFFATAAVLGLTCIALGGRTLSHLLFGAAFGAALACRINLALLVALYPVTLVYAWRRRQQSAGGLAWMSVPGMAAAALVFRLLQPYAFAGPGFFDIRLAADFVQALETIRALASGAADYPPSVQWIGRWPILFPGWNLLVWGLGPAFGLAALSGLVWAFVRRAPAAGDEPGAGRVALLWVPLLFLFHATQFAATVRYFLPIVPLLAVAAAWWLAGPTSPRLRRGAAIAVVVVTALWALAFTTIYRRPHTRVEASRWIHEHVTPGSTIANEHWDDGLPLAVAGGPAEGYTRVELRLYDEENEAKRAHLIETLDAADVLVLSSNRLYGSIPRTPWRYPLVRRYYELLFAGDLGFRLERVFTSYPALGPLVIADDRAEEAFTVYDHPKVLVYRKTPRYSSAEVARLLSAVSLAGIVHLPPREASALYYRTQPPDVRPPRGDEARAAATADAGSVASLLRWLALLETLSLAAFALLFRPLSPARDRGYALAKLMAWLMPGTAVWLLASTGLAPNATATARAVVGLLVAGGALAAWRSRAALLAFVRGARRRILATEAVFLGILALFLALRAFNPAIVWGEKPMDFAILNAAIRSVTMPPADPWFAGEPLNYFYFGHATTAVFTRAAGVPPAIGFNLAVATLGALLAVAVYAFAAQVSGRIAPAVAASLLVVIVGNLAGPRLWASGMTTAFTFDYFWATSRVVPGTINEFPFWNLTFGDLHAHVLAMPLEAALLYLGTLWMASGEARSAAGWLVQAGVTAWFLGALAVTSSWSLPTAVALQLGFLLTAWFSGGRTVRGVAGAILTWVAVCAAAFALFWPFWAGYAPPPRQFGPLQTEFAPLADVLTIFGVFLLAAAPALCANVARQEPRVRAVLCLSTLAVGVAAAALRSPAFGLFAALAVLGAAVWATERRDEVRAGALLVAASGALGAVTELVFVWDRMNTVFKYYLEMWLMLGSGAAVLAWAFARSARPRARRAFGAGLAVATAGGLFTSVTGAAGFLAHPFAASDVPTLDGMAYLERTGRGAELAAFRWLNREMPGIPVIVEAQGPPYQAFSRVSMNTGLPTLVGWEYHLFQQGRSRQELAARAGNVREIYESADLARAEELLRGYRVDLLFVGPLERDTYGAAGAAKFAASSMVQPVFRHGEVTIYATPGRARGAKTWIDPVPVESIALPVRAPLREPRDIALAPDGTLVVADFGNRRVQRLGRDLQPVGAFGRQGGEGGAFRDPCGIAVDDEGNVIVADTWNHRIQTLGADGRALAAWGGGLYGPRGVAVAPDGGVYVTDTGNHRVLRFSPDGTPHVIVQGVLDNPVGIAVAPGGEIYVADTGHRRVAVFSPDGAPLRAWKVPGWVPAPRMEPYLAVGPDGIVWVTEPTSRQVLLFAPDGTPVATASGDRPLELPLGIAVIDTDTAAVTDAATGRVVEVRRGGRPRHGN